MAEQRPNTVSTEAKQQPRLLKSGYPAHTFTREDAQKGGRRSAEVRRERAKTHSQRLRAQVERNEKALIDAAIEKAKEGSTQALQLLWSYAYGTPAKVEPDELDVNVMSGDAPRVHDLSAVLKLAEQAGVDVTSSGLDKSNTAS